MMLEKYGLSVERSARHYRVLLRCRSFSETIGSSSATNAHASFDLWFNDWQNEVMIQTDFAPSGARCDSHEASAAFGDSNGVAVQKWSLCQFGSGAEAHGSLAMYQGQRS
jgi:hypothetical protein